MKEITYKQTVEVEFGLKFTKPLSEPMSDLNGRFELISCGVGLYAYVYFDCFTSRFETLSLANLYPSIKEELAGLSTFGLKRHPIIVAARSQEITRGIDGYACRIVQRLLERTCLVEFWYENIDVYLTDSDEALRRSAYLLMKLGSAENLNSNIRNRNNARAP